MVSIYIYIHTHIYTYINTYIYIEMYRDVEGKTLSAH